MRQLEECQFRRASEADALHLRALKWELHKESEFLRLSPEERLETLEDEENRLRQESLSNVAWVALQGSVITGYIYAQVELTSSRVSRVTLGVRKEYRGLGIGIQLMKILEEWTKRSGFSHIELRVMGHNDPALRLYRRLGFGVQTEGTCTLYDTHQVVPEYRMMKQLI